MNAMNDALVSVVIPTRNRRERLQRALESVLRQTWPDIEIVVVDDASSDDTQAFLKGLSAAESRIRVLRNEVALGGAGARNAGVGIASGRYVAFLDDDDVWLPEKIERQMAMLANDPSVSAVSCWIYIDHESGRRQLMQLSPPAGHQQILASNHLGGASMCLTTKRALESIGGFDPRLRSGQDWDLWIKLCDVGRVQMCREPLVCYLPHDGERITGNPWSAYSGRRRIYRHYRKAMNADTKRHHLTELLYCRKVSLPASVNRQLCGLLSVLRYTGIFAGGRYVYRYLKSLFG